MTTSQAMNMIYNPPAARPCPSCGRGGWYAPRPYYPYPFTYAYNGDPYPFTYAYNGDPKAGVGAGATSGYVMTGSLR